MQIKTGFLPGRRHLILRLIGDDGFLMDCVVGQDGIIKPCSTTDDNPILGAYIRKRIGVPSGTFYYRLQI